MIAPYALLRRRRELASLTRREAALTVGAGALLAGHFATWVPSLRYTSVASATALVAVQPVWTMLIAGRMGRQVPVRAWWGAAVCLAGVLVLTGVDFSVSGRALFGDCWL